MSLVALGNGGIVLQSVSFGSLTEHHLLRRNLWMMVCITLISSLCRDEIAL